MRSASKDTRRKYDVNREATATLREEREERSGVANLPYRPFDIQIASTEQKARRSEQATQQTSCYNALSSCHNDDGRIGTAKTTVARQWLAALTVLRTAGADRSAEMAEGETG